MSLTVETIRTVHVNKRIIEYMAMRDSWEIIHRKLPRPPDYWEVIVELNNQIKMAKVRDLIGANSNE